MRAANVAFDKMRCDRSDDSARIRVESHGPHGSHLIEGKNGDSLHMNSDIFNTSFAKPQIENSAK